MNRLLAFRNSNSSDKYLAPNFFEVYKPSKGNSVNPDHPFSHLIDTANTMLNWLEYTQFIHREKGRACLISEHIDEVKRIVANPLPMISRPDDEEYFQRRYGLDPDHRKDTRNLSETQTVTAQMIAEHRVKQAFISCSLKEPIGGITSSLVDKIADMTGILPDIVDEVLRKNFPHGSIGAFMASCFEMAFNGRDDCREFEKATASIFRDVFGFQSDWLGSAQSGREVPDVLLVSDNAGYQAIIDTKAYSKYDLPTTQRDRMIYHYLPDISSYSDSAYPTRFFSYIAGGFSNTIATHLKKIVNDTGVNGSAMPVANFIKMIELQEKKHYTHEEIGKIFSLNKKIELADLEI